MKKILYIWVLFSAVVLSSCDNAVKNQEPDGATIQNDTVIDPEIVDNLTPATDKTKLWPAQTDNSTLCGFIDETGTMVIPAVYERTSSFSCGWALVMNEDKEYYFIDKNGNKGKLVDAYQLVDPYFYYNKLRVHSGDFIAMWNNNFKEVIPASYVQLGIATKDGLITFCQDKSSDTGWGYINNNGDVVISPQFAYAGEFENGIATVQVKKDGQNAYGIISTTGEYLIEPQKYMLYNMGYGIVGYMKENGECEVMDKTGHQLIETKYQYMNHYFEGLARVGKDGKYGFINTNCEEVISLVYANARECYDGVIWVRETIDSLWKLISKDGETILELKENEVPCMDYHNGLALVCLYDNSTLAYNYRYIDKNGETIYQWTSKVKF